MVPHLDGRSLTIEPEPLLIERGCSGRPWVALTLDAGAGSEPTGQILATLRERAVHLTFFLTGNWIRQNPDLVRQIVTDGHEVANHSLTHTDFRSLSDAQIANELAETEQVFQETTGVAMRPFFRPPYGAYDRRVLLTVIAQGYLPIFWTLDSLDSVGDPKTPEFLVERLTRTLPTGDLHDAILLAHCGSESTAEAMPALLDQFASLGLEVRPLSDVLQ
ncbi:MAG: polysaccharide deacetylase family protein [Chloroflexaceae bacterium]|nr:polysaccharide deacetylase family protein [Chloroflexaceae bacterium]